MYIFPTVKSALLPSFNIFTYCSLARYSIRHFTRPRSQSAPESFAHRLLSRWKFFSAKEGGKERRKKKVGASHFSPSHGPLRFVTSRLACHSRFGPFRARLWAKTEGHVRRRKEQVQSALRRAALIQAGPLVLLVNQDGMARKQLSAPDVDTYENWLFTRTNWVWWCTQWENDWERER